jgi:hypothetical protein
MIPKEMQAICQVDVCTEENNVPPIFFTNTRSAANSKFPILVASQPLDTFLNYSKKLN